MSLPAIAVGALVAGTGLQMAGAISQGEAARKNAAYNARLYRMQADEALREAAWEAGKIGKETRQLIGTQKAVAAAQGFDVSVGDPVAIILSTADVGVQEQRNVMRRGAAQALYYGQAASEAIRQGRDALRASYLTAAAYGLSSIPAAYMLGGFNFGSFSVPSASALPPGGFAGMMI